MSELKPIDPEDNNHDDAYPQPYRPAGELGGLHGEFSVLDRRMPQLKIVQNVGALSAKFPDRKGEILYGEHTFLAKPAGITIYGANKLYQQNLRYEEGVFPAVYETTQEVEKAGGNLKGFVRAGEDDTNFVPIILAHVVAELPAPASPKSKKGVAEITPVDGAFSYNGGTYVAGIYVARGSAYRALAGRLVGVRSQMQASQKQLAHFKFTLDSVYSKIGAFFVYVPIITRVGELNSDEFVAFLKKEVFVE
jgi:hypothetical protein